MMLAEYYPLLRDLHVGSALLSGALFCTRGARALRGTPKAPGPLIRALAILIDTVLLGAAVLLVLITGQYPLLHAWVTAKLGLLPLYVACGWVALRASAPQRRRQAFAAALILYGTILGIALGHRWLSAG